MAFLKVLVLAFTVSIISAKSTVSLNDIIDEFVNEFQNEDVQQDPSSSGCKVELWAEAGHSGEADEYTGRAARVKQNNAYKSLMLPDGCCVTVYVERNFKGGVQTFCDDVDNLSHSHFGNKISSLNVFAEVERYQAFRFGTWAKRNYCSPGSYIVGLKLKSEKDQGSEDDTALNQIKMLCSNGDLIVSGSGTWGTWQSTLSCPNKQPMTGFQLQIEPYAGGALIGEDDTAVNNVNFECNHDSNTQVSGNALTHWGTWRSWKRCPTGMAAIGFSVKKEGNQGLGDDTGVNGLSIFCGPYTQA